MYSTNRFRIVTVSILTCLIGLCNSGCRVSERYSSRYQPTPYQPTAPTLTGKQADWDVTSTIRPPSDWSAFDKTLTLVIESDPSGAEVFAVEQTEEGSLTSREKIGTTPLEVKIEFCEVDQIPWFRDPTVLDGRLRYYQRKGELPWAEGPGQKVGGVRYVGPTKGAFWSPVVRQYIKIVSKQDRNSFVAFETPYLHEVPLTDEFYLAENQLERHSDPRKEYRFLLYIEHGDCYGAFVKTGFGFDNAGTQVIGARGESLAIVDGVRMLPYGCPFRLLKHGRVLAQDMAKAVEQEDYYGAEELRLRRIDELERQLGNNKTFFDAVPESAPTITNAVQGRLIDSELDRLKHLVGLLDPTLMGLRKQMLVKLKEGDVDAAFALAQAIEAMEKRYFPPEPPRTIVVREPSTSTSTANVASGEAATVQGAGRQEIVVQEKPYYGVTNIIQALGAIRGNKLDPEAYQRAFGTAQLMDIMGLGSGILNK